MPLEFPSRLLSCSSGVLLAPQGAATFDLGEASFPVSKSVEKRYIYGSVVAQIGVLSKPSLDSSAQNGLNE
jgi:hypothetical protein